ncbi:hypothetical protein B0H19DRAFT_1242501 [Mycena capillaripes]|nr:hypothetical protein B0H19DRAFT_1242501 [Mycena capillaripes]
MRFKLEPCCCWNKTWLQGRAQLAVFVQEGFDWAVKRLGLDPLSIGPVTHVEQDLCRERIYGTRGDFKEWARIVVAGPATKEEQDRIVTANRELVAQLTDKSAFVLHKPTLSLVNLTLVTTALRAAIMEYSSGHYVPEAFARKVFKSHFDADLATICAWHTFTSNPTVIPRDGPVRMARAAFLMRTLQENIFAEARYNVLKDVVAPVPSTEVMGELDFALNQ